MQVPLAKRNDSSPVCQDAPKLTSPHVFEESSTVSPRFQLFIHLDIDFNVSGVWVLRDGWSAGSTVSAHLYFFIARKEEQYIIKQHSTPSMWAIA